MSAPTLNAPNALNPVPQVSGYTWANLKAGGLTGLLEALITANLTATATPTAAPTATATGGGSSGGTLASGNYYFKFTETNGFGETAASPESTQLTGVSAGNIPRVTFPSLKTGNTARNLYVTAAGGAVGTEVLYASGIQTTTYDLSTAAPTSTVVPPSASSTILTTGEIVRARMAEMGNLEVAFQRAASAISQYAAGKPMSAANIALILQEAAGGFALITQALFEAQVLVSANPGTLGTYYTPAGMPVPYRSV